MREKREVVFVLFFTNCRRTFWWCKTLNKEERKKNKRRRKIERTKKKQKTNENLEQKTKEKNFLAFFTQEVKTQFFTLSQFIIKYTILEEEEEEKSRERDERERD